jgi:two-component system, NarL family, sensor histidine kinase UhpB
MITLCQFSDKAFTQEKERNGLGKELHDNVNQMLVTAKMYLSHALNYSGQEKDMIRKGVCIIDSSIQELRQLSSSLVPPSFGDKSLEETICELIARIEFIKRKFLFPDFTTLDE